MCGIVGYLGKEDARGLILKGLTRLEYRGYDSAGIALYNNEKNVFSIYKDKGRVANLEQLTDFSYETHQGIGHTRWATHGIPNKINSHPHKSSTDSFYIVHNGVGTLSGPGGFNGYIGGGQGFFVNMLDGIASTSTVTFNNSLRSSTYNNSQFYRTGTDEINESRLWLDITNSESNSDRTLIGYVRDATNEYDRIFDAMDISVGKTMKVYTILDGKEYTIQGRALPFDNNDILKVGIKVELSGIYNIGLSYLDGDINRENIYIEDTFLNITHDIKESPYMFYTEVGKFDNRFILKYKNNVDNIEINEITEFYYIDNHLLLSLIHI